MCPLLALAEAAPAGHAATAAHLLGQHLPGDGGPEDKQDADEVANLVTDRHETFRPFELDHAGA